MISSCNLVTIFLKKFLTSCRAKMVLSPLGRCSSSAMTTQFAEKQENKMKTFQKSISFFVFAKYSWDVTVANNEGRLYILKRYNFTAKWVEIFYFILFKQGAAKNSSYDKQNLKDNPKNYIGACPKWLHSYDVMWSKSLCAKMAFSLLSHHLLIWRHLRMAHYVTLKEGKYC